MNLKVIAQGMIRAEIIRISKTDGPARWFDFGNLLRQHPAEFFSPFQNELNQLLQLEYQANEINGTISYNLVDLFEESKTSRYYSLRLFMPTPLLNLKQIFDHRPLKPDDVFVDIGSGLGHANRVAALMQPEAQHYGVELNPRFVIQAQKFITGQNFPVSVHFERQDIFKCENLIGRATYCYHFQNFSEPGLVELVDFWKNSARSGSVLVLNIHDQHLNPLRQLHGFEVEKMKKEPLVQVPSMYEIYFLVKN